MMEQMEMDMRTDAEAAADGAVDTAVRMISKLYRDEIRIRSGYEAFGVIMEAEGKTLSFRKSIQKATEKMLGTLDTGVETAAALAAIGRFVEEMAQEAIMMAAKARVCIDYLTNQERVRDVDPETGEMLEGEE